MLKHLPSNMTLAKEKPLATSAGEASTNDTSVYTVLYYKRKNKVHKSKGVSKMDGLLTIAPGSMVSLSTPCGIPVVAPRREPEIAKQKLEEDSVVNLGSHEIEIVSLRSGDDITSSQGSKTFPSKSLPATFRRPLSSNTAVASLPGNKYASKTKIHGSKCALPPLGVTQINAQNTRLVSRAGSKRSLSTEPPQPQPRGKPRLAPLHHRPWHKPQPTGAAFGPIQPVGAVSLFPGAVGTIDLPHSISSALKPHQRTGLVFLWNCLTGNGEVSPHAYNRNDESNDDDENQQKYYKGGCVLGKVYVENRHFMIHHF